MTRDVNLELAGLLFDLVHVAGEKNPRAFGYTRAARAVLRLDRQITPLVTANTFRAIPGIGPTTDRIARELIKRAAGEIFEGYFVGIDFSRTVQWFDEGNKLLLADTAAASECVGLIDLESASAGPAEADIASAHVMHPALFGQKRRHPHLRAVTFDLPVVEPIARRTIAEVKTIALTQHVHFQVIYRQRLSQRFLRNV